MTFNIDFQWASLIIFLIVMSIAIFKNRKNLEIQKILFPFLYAGLFRTGFGIKFMQKISDKYKELIKFLGLCGVGFGFVGMGFIFYSLFQTLYLVISKPSIGSGVALVLPQTTIPGIGFLPFWYWLIALTVIVIIHEFSHGIVAKANDLKIKSSGLGFFGIIIPAIPLAFVEPDEKKLEKAPDHVKYSVFAAGPMSNIVTALIILLMFQFIFFPLDGIMTEPVGMSFDSINESYPSASLPEDFVLSSFNGKEIMNTNDFVYQMQLTRSNDVVNLSDGMNSYLITMAEHPDDSSRAYLGVTSFVDEMRVKDGIDLIAYNFYKWFRDLFKIIGLFSLIIGLMNLLPLGPVDGGQMMRTLLQRISKDKEVAMKRFAFISLLCLLLIVMSFVWPYFV